ncbi:FAD binding domain protein [Nemania sp. FL0916]|nr:FAD binding domain protein [Nemania sp. FL0916]
MATTDDVRLRVAIVGSGIAGLAAARVLREKHDVTVYERGEPSVSTGGQGIANFPNSTHLLRDMGFDYKRVGSVELGAWNTIDKAGNHLNSVDYNMRERYGNPLVSHMRVDVRTELLRLATAPAEDLGLEPTAVPATMMWNNGAVDLDAAAGKVTLEDGSVVEADVVVIADGIHSRLRNKVLDVPVNARKTGMTCCRVAVSAEDAVKALGKLPSWWQEQRDTEQGSMRLVESMDNTARLLVMYPLRDISWMNMAWMFQTRQERATTTESWNADGDRDEIMEIFADYDDEVKTLLRVASEVKLWELQDLEPLPTWTAGRAILIGDAAHAMTPMQGQGSNMAIEDADGLRLLTQPGVTRDSVPGILEKIASIRRPRATKVLINTRFAARVSTAAERTSRFDYNCTYPGILNIMKEQATVG